MVKLATASLLTAAFALSAVTCAPQLLAGFSGDPSMAKIIQEQRFNAGDGRFGHAALQEDGVSFKEETNGNNQRVGQYQYVGDDGQLYTVKYEAGVNGFRILGGDHIPSGGQNSANAEQEEAREYEYEYYDNSEVVSPFVNPFDPTHQKPELLAGNLAGHLAGLVSTHADAPTTARPGEATTSPPLRVFPRGQVELERFPEGFMFNFKSE